MNLLKDLKLERNSVMPLYIQIAESIMAGIAQGQIENNDRLPSINGFSKEYKVSRDTVERAYKVLKKRNFAVAKRGKGMYIYNDITEVCPDCDNDIYNILKADLNKIRKYKRLNLVVDNANPYFKKINYAFVKFCNEESLDFNLINKIEDLEMINLEDLFIVIQDEELYKLIDLVKIKGLVLGSDLGIISYNEALFKQLLDIGLATKKWTIS